MVDFSDTELRNASARFFVGSFIPSFLGGANDPESLHEQIVEAAKTVFVLNPTAIFSLAALVRNKTNELLSRQIDLVEDMLIVSEDVVQLQNLILPANSSTLLRNAATNLLNVETSASIKGRPELGQFSRQIDEFAEQFRPLISGSKLRFHPDEARQLLLDDFQELTKTHETLLTLLSNLSSLLAVYEALDISSILATTSIARTRSVLLDLADQVQTGEQSNNQSTSRNFLLTVLAAKASVKSLSEFVVPNQKYALKSDGTGFATKGIIGRSSKSLGSGPPFLMRPTGQAIPAQILSNEGPWLLDDLSQTSLSIVVDGGGTQTVDLSGVQGPGIHGTIEGPWPDSILHPTWPGPAAATAAPPVLASNYDAANMFHIVVDNNSYTWTTLRWGFIQDSGVSLMEGEDTSAGVAPAPRDSTVPSNIPDTPPTNNNLLISDYWTTVRMQPPIKLGFIHLGATIHFLFPTVVPGSSSSSAAVDNAGFASWSVSGADQLGNPQAWAEVKSTRWTHLFRARILTELTLLKNVAITISGSTVTGPATSFEAHYVGFYIRTGTAPTFERYEIIRFISDTQIEVDFRGDTVANQTVGLFGSRGDYTQVSFFPDLLINTRDVADSDNLGPHNVRDTVSVVVSPVTKTSSIPSGLPTGSISEVVTALNDESNGSHGSNKYAHASYHVLFKEQPGGANKLTIEGRSRFMPEHLRLSTSYSSVDGTFASFTNPVLASGSSATLVSISTSRQLWSGMTGLAANNIGDSIVISGAATAANNGTFEIVDISKDTPPATVDPLVGAPIAGSPIIYNPNGTGTDANSGSISWQVVRVEESFPAPKQAIRITNTATHVFGFSPNQRTANTQSVYLDTAILSALVRNSVSGLTVTEVPTVLREGQLRTVANTFTVTDTAGVDLAPLGIVSGVSLILLEGGDAGEYIITNVSVSTLTLEFPGGKNSRGFTRNSAPLRYRLIKRRILLTSNSKTRGSSIQVTSAPTSLGFSSLTQFGLSPSLEAVNAAGQKLDLSGLLVGDQINNHQVSSVAASGEFVNLVSGISTEDTSFVFTATSSLETNYRQLAENVQTLLTASSLFSKYRFDENLDFLDGVLSPVVSQGASQLPDVGRLQQVLAELHSMLTSSIRRSTEITTNIPNAALNAEDILASFSAPQSASLNALIAVLQEKGYDRAVELLDVGQLDEFFSVSLAESSFAGNFVSKARASVFDLPVQSQSTSRVTELVTTADTEVVLTDPDTDFSDTVGELEGDLV